MVNQFLRKVQNAGNFLQKKVLAPGGKFLQKASSVGGRVLDTVAKIEPGLAANPLFQGARAGLAIADLAGKTATGLSNATSIETVGSSLGDAYKGYNAMKATAPPAPGLETAQSAAL